MTAARDEARLAIQKAREALRNNDRTQARQWAERASRLSPEFEDSWLILAAVASPRASLEYVQTALKVNPESARAHRAMQWAMQRLQQPQPPAAPTKKSAAVAPSAVPAAGAAPAARLAPTPKAARRSPVLGIVLLAVGCVVFAIAAWSAVTSPVMASMLQLPWTTAPKYAPSWAQASIPKPTYTPSGPMAAEPGLNATPTPDLLQTLAPDQNDLSTALPTEQATESPTEQPTATPEAETSVPTAEPTWSGSLGMEIVPDTPTSELPTPAPAPATAEAPPPGSPGGGTHWIDVNLTQQTLYAYAGDTVVNSFLVSTGTWLHPTVTGKYHIYVKLRYTDMSGPDYYLPNVPYTMYFYEGYGLHGTYWHHNFGTPMSHGCVNLSIPDAAWLYDFSSVGTLVSVHY